MALLLDVADNQTDACAVGLLRTICGRLRSEDFDVSIEEAQLGVDAISAMIYENGALVDGIEAAVDTLQAAMQADVLVCHVVSTDGTLRLSLSLRRCRSTVSNAEDAVESLQVIALLSSLLERFPRAPSRFVQSVAQSLFQILTLQRTLSRRALH